MQKMLRILVLFAAIACVFAVESRTAIVILNGQAQGNVTFKENHDGILIEGYIENLSEGLHGFHIHEKGDLSRGCDSTGGHLNPYKVHHGGPLDSTRHIGDLGNIHADYNGIAQFQMKDVAISLDPTSVRNILGRAVVVHSGEDDLGKGGFSDSLTTGHAGSRIACGIIGVLEPTDWTSSAIFPRFNGLTFLFTLIVILRSDLF